MCDRLRSYVCKQPYSDTPFEPVTTTTAAPDSTNCGRDWIENPSTGKCYQQIRQNLTQLLPLFPILFSRFGIAFPHPLHISTLYFHTLYFFLLHSILYISFLLHSILLYNFIILFLVLPSSSCDKKATYKIFLATGQLSSAFVCLLLFFMTRTHCVIK